MDIRLDKDALAVDDAMTMIRARPLDRAKSDQRLDQRGGVGV
jgi:hypothetical protein